MPEAPDRRRRPGPRPTDSPSPGSAAFMIGEPAPDLRLATLGGAEVDLASLRGHPVWINFMATWCPPCRDEIPLMNGFAVRYADAGLVVVAVDVREGADAVGAFADDLAIRFDVALDGDGSAQDRWGALALPVHYWIDADGVIRDGALGGIGPDIMAAGLRRIMPGVDVQP